MKNKKMQAILMSLVLSAGVLTACGSNNENLPAENVEVESEEAAEETTETETPEVSETEESATADIVEEAVEASEDEDMEKTVADYTAGTWDGTTYTNESLGFKMTFPETYTIYTGDMLKNLMGVAVDTVTENSDIQNINQEALTYEFMAMAPDQVGNVLFTIEENVQELTAEEYVDALVQTFDLMGVPYEVMQEKGFQTVGDNEFCMIGLMTDYSEMTGIEGNVAIQAYSVLADADFLYYFVVTFSEDTVEELGSIMDGIEAL